MKRALIYVLGVVCVMTSCVEEEFTKENGVITIGDEVQFSASVDEGVQTRTVYGADNNSALNVYWVNGDTIAVYGTNCLAGRQQAVYEVQGVTVATPNKDSGTKDTITSTDADGNTTTTEVTYGGQNYAGTLEKTGEVGVQWGEETSDFCAVYPASGVEFSSDVNTGDIIASTSIGSTQNYIFDSTPIDGVWKGTSSGSDRANPSMQNAIMYARTDNVKRGDPVNLRFKPLSTMLRFRFSGYSSNNDDSIVYIQSITVTAPEGYCLSGDFDLTIPKSSSENNAVTVSATGNNTNTITIYPMLSGGTYVPLTQNQALDFDVFALKPDGQDWHMGGNVTRKTEQVSNTTTNEDGTTTTTTTNVVTYTCESNWSVSIKTDYGIFDYNIIPKFDANKDGFINSDDETAEVINQLENGEYTANTYSIVSSKVHKINVPTLTVPGDKAWDPSKWITQIPTPVYISELSVPGAWYCTNSSYQSTTNLSEQFNKGIRAFNIDCRASKYRGWMNSYSDGDTDILLQCAGTEKSTVGSISKGTEVKSVLESLISLIEQHKDEYIIAVLTIAEKPFTSSNVKYGTVNPAVVLPMIKDIYDALPAHSVADDGTITAGIYKKEIDSNTTIDDVVGSVIIKVNTNTTYDIYNALQTKYSIPTTLMSSSSMSPNDDSTYGIVAGSFDKMNSTPIYWNNEMTDLQFYYHQAQRTTWDGDDYEVSGFPTYGDRKAAIDDIVEQSKSIYNSGKHNAWFQIGLGGSRKNSNDGDNDASQLEVAQTLNPYLYGKIMNKINTDPSPVGIVLMNFCTDETDYSSTVDNVTYSASSLDLVNAIIEMNGKFYLNRVGGTTTGGDNGTPIQLSNGAYAVVGENAF